jgi:hypothetical protein
MKGFFKTVIYLWILGLLSACSSQQANRSVLGVTATPDNETRTLASLKQVDDYPLYTMQYYGEYALPQTSMLPTVKQTSPGPGWACSLFTVLLDEDHLLYGRNFDWDFSPALLLFTNPPDGYSSVSMVDLEFLGFNKETASHLTDLPPKDLKDLLSAPRLPFDGMNEQGLAIGMAAVPSGDMKADPSRKTIGSLGVIRQILDHAKNVEEAVNIIKQYNIDFTGGPPIHYLIADATGKAVLVEFYQGEMHVIGNDHPWQSATNFLRSSVDNPKGNCWRYDKINARMNEKQGLLDSTSAMQLLSEVAQDNTQWSVVYQMGRAEISIAMGRDYADIHTFQTLDYWNPR